MPSAAIAGDQLIEFACERAGAALAQLSVKRDPYWVGERKHLQPAFQEALRERVGDRVSQYEKRLKLPGWRGRLGGIDVIVHDECGVSPVYLY